MLISGQPYTAITFHQASHHITVVDQTCLPHLFKTITLQTLEEVVCAICEMKVRGAPLIGITAAYGFYFALRENASDESLQSAYQSLLRTRPTAVNLKWALEQIKTATTKLSQAKRAQTALEIANELRKQDIQVCERIGEYGCDLIAKCYESKKQPIQILTHCNTGWLATAGCGTALSPIYKAHQKNIPIHVWVDETRPRNQGYLTYWELSKAEIPCTLVVDNAGGHLMQKGQVDLCLVGADRVAQNGDAINKIGTYLKALAAFDNQIPFYVALPSSTFDNTLESADEVPIEERSHLEISHCFGLTQNNTFETIQITPQNARFSNPGFDITPAKLITGYITEHGIKRM